MTSRFQKIEIARLGFLLTTLNCLRRPACLGLSSRFYYLDLESRGSLCFDDEFHCVDYLIEARRKKKKEGERLILKDFFFMIEVYQISFSLDEFTFILILY